MQPIRALGAMSGTSMDGIDAAEILTDGERILAFGPSQYIEYTKEDRDVLRAAQGKWQGEPGVAEAAEIVETQHARLLARFPKAEIVGFHGQTLAHDPANRRTHQAGDGALLAQVLDKPVVWDFRSADVALGGEGAPLAPLFHHACAAFIRAKEPLAFLNLGGVGNITWVDPTDPDPARALLAFDTGPANAPLDDLILRQTGQRYDVDGALALSGTADAGLVSAFLRAPYFSRKPPKSLDRNAFVAQARAIDALPLPDAAATWVAIIALTVSHALGQCPSAPHRLLVTGGGRKNPAIMGALSAVCDCPVAPVEDVELNGDMLEAQAFAYLAVRVLAGLPTTFPGTTGVGAEVGGGIVSGLDGAIAPSVAAARHAGTRSINRA